MKRFVLITGILALYLCSALFGSEYEDGRIRLTLNPQVGRFSLYYLTDVGQRKYEALFMDQDPRTTVLSLSYNGKMYRLGESDEFQIREGGSPRQPALIFESSFIRVTEEFSFIATPGSQTANGVRIGFRIENKTNRRIQAGLRFLLDTKLGETTFTPFTTDIRTIEEETQFTSKNSKDKFWISGSTSDLVLMGSLSANVDRVPDLVHIANWKRLDEVPWYLNFAGGRKFNNPPYSIRDSAVAYYYEPVRINRGESSSFYLLLSSWDTRGFAGFRPSDGSSPAVPPVRTAAPTGGRTGDVPPPLPPGEGPQTVYTIPENVNPVIIQSDSRELQSIVDRINRYIESGAQMSDDEVASIEQDLARIKSRYISP
jgi:hypothetical protein